MEIELTGLTNEKLKSPLAILCAGLALAIFFGLLGARFTPVNASGEPALLNWSEWRILVAERAYRAELAHLQQEVDQLAAALEQLPDPVRAQVNAERIARQYKDGQPALEYQRAQLVSAATAVQDWAAGVISHDQAAGAVNAAVDSLLSLDGAR